MSMWRLVEIAERCICLDAMLVVDILEQWWLETNGEPGLQKKRKMGRRGKYHPGDEKLGGYHACGTTHEANSTDKFLDGYYIMKGSDRPQNVIVWRGPKRR